MDRAEKKRARPDSAGRTQATPNPSLAQSVPVDLRALRPNDIPRLQRSIGNRATRHLLTQSRAGNPTPAVQRLPFEQVHSLIEGVLGENSDANVGEGALKAIATAIAEATSNWEGREGGDPALREKHILEKLESLVSDMADFFQDTPTTAEGWIALLQPAMVDQLPLERIPTVDEGPADEDRDQFLANAAKMERAGPEQIRALGKMWNLGDGTQRDRIRAVMGGKNDLRRMSDLGYFLEQVSPIHVNADAASPWFEHWSQGVLNWGRDTAWADYVKAKLEERRADGEKEPKVIDSYDEETRAQYELTPRGQHIFKASGQPLVGENIYVLSEDNVWYGGSKDGPVHHSSFLQGAPVQCAGYLSTDEAGKLSEIDNHSGHYKPTEADLKRAMKVLDTQMDTSEVRMVVR